MAWRNNLAGRAAAGTKKGAGKRDAIKKFKTGAQGRHKNEQFLSITKIYGPLGGQN